MPKALSSENHETNTMLPEPPVKATFKMVGLKQQITVKKEKKNWSIEQEMPYDFAPNTNHYILQENLAEIT